MRLLKILFGWIKRKEQKNTLDYNVDKMRDDYPLDEQGYFGKKGKSKGKPAQKQAVRVIESDNQYRTAKDFYSKISKGGKESRLANGKGKRNDLPDKTTIIYRKKTSSPNSPAVSLKTNQSSKVKSQKIHFEKEKK